MESVDGMQDYNLRVLHEEMVFYGVDEVIQRIVKSTKFKRWTKSESVDLELWFGNDEKTKIEDTRELKEENEKLKKIIETMKSKQED